MKFQIKKNVQGQFFWIFKASNGLTLASSGEAYHNKADCIAGINLVKASYYSQYVFFLDVNKQWRWHLTAANSKIIAVSSEGYVNKSDAENSARIVASANANTPVEDLT